MLKRLLQVVLGVGLAMPALALAQPSVPIAATARPDPLPRMTVDEALAAETHPLSRRVLQLIKVMEDAVVEAKKPGFSEASWAPLADLVDTARFRRVGNFSEVGGWKEYVSLLTPWARSSWYSGRIRRINQVGNLVYLETEERSSTKGPFGEEGGYQTLNSNAVYAFDADGKITDLWVYDQMSRAAGR